MFTNNDLFREEILFMHGFEQGVEETILFVDCGRIMEEDDHYELAESLLDEWFDNVRLRMFHDMVSRWNLRDQGNFEEGFRAGVAYQASVEGL